MKLLVLSDSHGKTANIRTVLDYIAGRFDGVIHLGDLTADIEGFRKSLGGKPVYSVRGNCDGYGCDAPSENIITVSGRKILLTHGHKYNVKLGLQRLAYAAEEKGVDVCLFGHTHVPEIFTVGQILFMNPGSISLPRDGDSPGYGMIAIDGNDSYASVIALRGNTPELLLSIPL